MISLTLLFLNTSLSTIKWLESEKVVLTQFSQQMGAYKYVEELSKKKQSDVSRFLSRVRCWEVLSPRSLQVDDTL